MDLVYLAATIDCEGALGAYWNNARYDPRLEISNTNPVLIDWLNATFPGGHVYLRKGKGNRKDQYQWMFYNGAKLEAMLKSVLPYLKLKGEQARIVLAIMLIQKKMSSDNPLVTALKDRLTVINKRGVA